MGCGRQRFFRLSDPKCDVCLCLVNTPTAVRIVCPKLNLHIRTLGTVRPFFDGQSLMVFEILSFIITPADVKFAPIIGQLLKKYLVGHGIHDPDSARILFVQMDGTGYIVCTVLVSHNIQGPLLPTDRAVFTQFGFLRCPIGKQRTETADGVNGQLSFGIVGMLVDSDVTRITEFDGDARIVSIRSLPCRTEISRLVNVQIDGIDIEIHALIRLIRSACFK